MVPRHSQNRESPENEVRYRVSACRKRLRATHRSQHPTQLDGGSNEDRRQPARSETYAEHESAMSQSSITGLMERLTADSKEEFSETPGEREEAAIT